MSNKVQNQEKTEVPRQGRDWMPSKSDWVSTLTVVVPLAIFAITYVLNIEQRLSKVSEQAKSFASKYEIVSLQEKVKGSATQKDLESIIGKLMLVTRDLEQVVVKKHEFEAAKGDLQNKILEKVNSQLEANNRDVQELIREVQVMGANLENATFSISELAKRINKSLDKNDDQMSKLDTEIDKVREKLAELSAQASRKEG